MTTATRFGRRDVMTFGAASVLCASANLHPAIAANNDAVGTALAQFPVFQSRRSVAGTISLWGHGSFKHDFMGRLVNRWIAEFKATHPKVTFDYRMFGTASAIGALITGAGNLAILGEEINPAASRAFRRAKGYAPTGFSIATGSVDVNFFDYAHMIFVHRANPIGRLSLPQLADIFGGEAQDLRSLARTWGDLGISGPLAAQRIQPYGWETDEDFGLFFRERVLRDSHRWNPGIREFAHARRPDGTQYDHGQRILDALALDPAGVAISNVRYLNAMVRPLPLAWTDDGRFVDANAETLIWQRYPLVRIIPAYVDAGPGMPVDPVLAEFLTYILCREGQRALVDESGYLPVSPHIAAEERLRLS